MGKGRRMGVLEAPMADKRCSGVWEGDRWGEQPGPALSAAPPPPALFSQFLMAPPSCGH